MRFWGQFDLGIYGFHSVSRQLHPNCTRSGKATLRHRFIRAVASTRCPSGLTAKIGDEKGIEHDGGKEEDTAEDDIKSIKGAARARRAAST